MKKKLSYNILFSLLLQIVAVINSFITSKITINYFGSEINGLVSSINQFLGISSVGRAPALQAGGHEFESRILHFIRRAAEKSAAFLCAKKYIIISILQRKEKKRKIKS